MVTYLTLVVAIDQVLAFANRVLRLTGDAELAKEKESFEPRCIRHPAVRDVVAHLDDYPVGEGWRQTGGKLPAISQKYLSALIWLANGGGTMLTSGVSS